MGIDTKVIHLVFKDYEKKQCVIVEFSICNYQKISFPWTDNDEVIAEAITKKVLLKQALIERVHGLALAKIGRERLGNFQNYKLKKKICTKTSKAVSKDKKLWCPKACQSFTILVYCPPGYQKSYAPGYSHPKKDVVKHVIRISAHQNHHDDNTLTQISSSVSSKQSKKVQKEAHHVQQYEEPSVDWKRTARDFKERAQGHIENLGSREESTDFFPSQWREKAQNLSDQARERAKLLASQAQEFKQNFPERVRKFDHTRYYPTRFRESSPTESTSVFSSRPRRPFRAELESVGRDLDGARKRAYRTGADALTASGRSFEDTAERWRRTAEDTLKDPSLSTQAERVFGDAGQYLKRQRTDTGEYLKRGLGDVSESAGHWISDRKRDAEKYMYETQDSPYHFRG